MTIALTSKIIITTSVPPIESEIVDKLYGLLSDQDTQVVVNAILALETILIDEGGVVINRAIAQHMIRRYKDWTPGQLQVVLGVLCRYKPETDDEIYEIMVTFCCFCLPCICFKRVYPKRTFKSGVDACAFFFYRMMWMMGFNTRRWRFRWRPCGYLSGCLRIWQKLTRMFRRPLKRLYSSIWNLLTPTLSLLRCTIWY